MKPLWFGTCEETGKRCYPSRKVAKRASRQMPHRGGHFHAYRCEACDQFHLGHLPAWVANGSIPRTYLTKENR